VDPGKCLGLALNRGGVEYFESQLMARCHCNVLEQTRDAHRICDNRGRLSAGTDTADDIIADLEQTLEAE
jgi:cystathionine beta-lyase/cystathionine gamma-synthase